MRNGNVIEITATAEKGHEFLNWSNNGTIISSANPLSMEVNNDITLIANFQKEIKYFELQLETTDGGSVNGDGEFPEDTNTLIIATPDSCYNFKHWTDENNNIISTENPLEVIVINDTILIAHFELQSVIIILEATDGGSVADFPYVVIHCGETISITAISDSGYIFVGWTDINGDTISTSNPLNIILISDTTLTANFEDVDGIPEYDIYDISIVPNPTESDFSIIFENTDEQMISIELLDITGAKILEIFSGFAPAEKLIYKVDSKLASGSYLIKFVIGEKQVVRKVVVK